MNRAKSTLMGCSGSLALVLLVLVPNAQAQSLVNCNSKLHSGTTYDTYHQGPGLSFTGKIEITRTFHCAQGTCFQANMTFDNYGPNVDEAEGYWRGSSIRFTRSVSQDDTEQRWSGQCLANSVRGQWSYIPNNPDNRGSFSITY